MRSTLMIMVLAGTLGVPALAQKDDRAAGEKRAALEVAGMTCGVCAARVEKAARDVAGVNAAKVDHEKGTAEITYDPARTSPESVAKAIATTTPFKAKVRPQRQK